MTRVILVLVLLLSMDAGARKGHMRVNCMQAYPYNPNSPYLLDLYKDCYKAQKSSHKRLRYIRKPSFLSPSEWREEVNACYRDSPGLAVGIDYVAALNCVHSERERIITEHKRNEGYEAFRRDDYAGAILAWRPLAKAGDADSQNSFGVLHEYGMGVRKDYVQAYAWFSLAAAQGSTIASKNKNDIGEKMTAAQTAKAQKLIRRLCSNIPNCIP